MGYTFFGIQESCSHSLPLLHSSTRSVYKVKSAPGHPTVTDEWKLTTMRHSPNCLQKSPRLEPKQLRNSTKQGFHCGVSGEFLISKHTRSSQTTLVSSIHLPVSEKLMTFKSKHDLRPTASSGLINTGYASSIMGLLFFFREGVSKKCSFWTAPSLLLWDTAFFEWIQQAWKLFSSCSNIRTWKLHYMWLNMYQFFQTLVPIDYLEFFCCCGLFIYK